MTKSQAIKIFGNASRLAEALGVTPGAISQWPDDLDVAKTQRVIGAAMQKGLADRVPKDLVPAAA